MSRRRPKDASSNNLKFSRDEAELADLMKRAQAGEARSYRVLLTRVQELMTSYVGHSFTRLGLAAFGGQEDVIQEILLAIHAKRETYDPNQFFLPWMYAIARYKVIDHLRRNKVAIHSSVPIEDEIENLTTVMSDGLGTNRDVQSLIEKLPTKQREVLQLVKIDGLSIVEAARKTGYSPSDIKVTVHRAIKTLQKDLKQ